jgi:hypothetical protein
VRAANLLASNGSSWVSLFRRHNSGTYNNQYMVLDLKRFQPGYQLQSELLWVVEQLPGMVEAADLTEVRPNSCHASAVLSSLMQSSSSNAERWHWVVLNPCLCSLFHQQQQCVMGVPGPGLVTASGSQLLLLPPPVPSLSPDC